MKPLPRILAFFLSFAIALPNSAFALRDQPIREKKPQILTGLEEALRSSNPVAGVEAPTETQLLHAIEILQSGGKGKKQRTLGALSAWLTLNPLPPSLTGQNAQLLTQTLFSLLRYDQPSFFNRLCPAIVKLINAGHPFVYLFLQQREVLRDYASEKTAVRFYYPDKEPEEDGSLGISSKPFSQDKAKRVQSILNALDKALQGPAGLLAAKMREREWLQSELDHVLATLERLRKELPKEPENRILASLAGAKRNLGNGKKFISARLGTADEDSALNSAGVALIEAWRAIAENMRHYRLSSDQDLNRALVFPSVTWWQTAMQKLTEPAPVQLSAAGAEEYRRKAKELRALVHQAEQILASQEKTGWLREKVSQNASDVYFTEKGVAYLPVTQGPLFVIGDEHGDLESLQRAIRATGYLAEDPQRPYLVFVGDYWDVGKKSLETTLLTLRLFIRDPEHVFLLGGNHDRDGPTRGSKDVIQHGLRWFFLELGENLGVTDGDALFRELTEFARRLPNLFVARNGIAVIHASPPSADLDPRFEAGKGLLSISGNEILRDLLACNLIAHPEEQMDRPNTTFRQMHEHLQMSHWIGQQGINRFLDSIGATVLVRGHNRKGPLMPTHQAKVLTVITTGWRSEDHGYPTEDRIEARIARFDLGRTYTEIPSDVVFPLWTVAAGAEESGFVAVEGLIAAVPAGIEEKGYGVVIGLNQAAGASEMGRMPPSRLIAVAAGAEEAEVIRLLGIPSDQIVSTKAGAIRLATGLLETIQGFQVVRVLDTTARTLPELQKWMQKLPAAWQGSLTTGLEENVLQLEKLSQIGV